MIRVGIAGFGIVGKIRFDILSKLDFANVVLISEIREDVFSPPDVLRVDDYRDIDYESIDAIFVCLPNADAVNVTEAALKNNVSVFCEKPPARSVTELEKIEPVVLADNSPLLVYGFNHRYHPSVMMAKSFIKENKFGRVLGLTGTYGKSSVVTFDQTNWRTRAAVAGGGILLDQGIHMLDLFAFLISEKFAVHSAIVSNAFWGFDVEDNVHAMLQSETNIPALLHSSATLWQHTFRLEINCELGGLRLEGLLTNSKSYGDETLTFWARDEQTVEARHEQLVRFPIEDSWALEINKFMDSLRSGSFDSSQNYFQAKSVMTLVEEIYEAGKKRR